MHGQEACPSLGVCGAGSLLRVGHCPIFQCLLPLPSRLLTRWVLRESPALPRPTLHVLGPSNCHPSQTPLTQPGSASAWVGAQGSQGSPCAPLPLSGLGPLLWEWVSKRPQSRRRSSLPGLSLILYSGSCSSHKNRPHPHMRFFPTWCLQLSHTVFLCLCKLLE